MGRKKRLLERKKNVKPSKDDDRSVDIEETSSLDDDDVDNSSEYVVAIEDILSQQTGEQEYLRLKGLRGHLPLAFFSHPAFSNLRILNLRGCDIRSLPPQIRQLRHLKHLDVTGNDRLRLPAQLLKLNLQRFLFPISLQNLSEDSMLSFNPVLTRSYCGDKTFDRFPRLSRLAAKAIVSDCTLEELDELREYVPSHLKDYLLPNVCSECGSVGEKIVATRVRKGVIAFNQLPLHYALCSPICLERIQETWRLEELLNNEKRALRLQKFGRVEAQHNLQYAYA